MTYFVLWSGGLDSTFLILKLLYDGHNVIAGRVNLMNNKEKEIYELKAIENLVPIFNLIISNLNWKVTFEYRGVIANIETLGKPICDLYQVPGWISALHLYLQDLKVDKVAIGYVANDDALSYLNEIKIYYESIKGISLYGMKLPTLEFPIIKFKKEYWKCLY